MKSATPHTGLGAAKHIFAAAVLVASVSAGGMITRGLPSSPPDPGDGGGTDPGTGVECGDVISGFGARPSADTPTRVVPRTSPADTIPLNIIE